VILSPLILAEIDYHLLKWGGVAAETAFLEEVERGAYDLVSFDAEDVGRARPLVEKYSDLAIGLADASIVVLAARFGTDRVLTTDERHFRALRGLDGRPFRILPADA
jgi:uncharacterized protein